MKKNIDVIIPVKDRQELLLKALHSINSQKLLPANVIIVDDCSKKKILINKKYKFKVKIFRNKVNKGVSFSRNKGVKLSKNNYVSFLDSDDFWVNDKLNTQYRIMKKFNLDFLSSDLYFLKKNYEKNKINLIKFFLSLISFPNPSSMIVKRNVFLKIGGFDEELMTCEDNDFWVKMLFSKYKILGIKEKKVMVNKFSDGQLSRNFNLREQSVQKFLKKNENKFLKYLNIIDLKKFENDYLVKAYIPIIKKSFINFEIKIMLNLIPKLLNKKFFYKRLFNFFSKKLV